MWRIFIAPIGSEERAWEIESGHRQIVERGEPKRKRAKQDCKRRIRVQRAGESERRDSEQKKNRTEKSYELSGRRGHRYFDRHDQVPFETVSSAREGVHQPADADGYDQESEEGPDGVADALGRGVL